MTAQGREGREAGAKRGGEGRKKLTTQASYKRGVDESSKTDRNWQAPSSMGVPLAKVKLSWLEEK